ncbi:MAG: nucleoside triphosphate pyrophosphohydrolase [Thermoanaerobaculia bacterium]
MDLKKLKKLMEKLRSEEGCPWDRAQNFETLKTFLLEETYEVLEAIDEKDPEKLKEELGDLLFQIIFQAQLAEERGYFKLEEVIENVYKKMVDRHPHVFGDIKLKTKEEVLERWEQRKHKSSKDGIDAPSTLPALLKAYRLSDKAKQLGFDWQRVEDIEEKLKEEVGEFCKALKEERERAKEELGDILFVLANIARHLRIDPEAALQSTNSKFLKRFNFILKKLKEKGIEPKSLKIEEWDKLWEEAKKNFK